MAPRPKSLRTATVGRVSLLNPHKSYIVSSSFWWRNWSLKRLSKLFKVTKLTMEALETRIHQSYSFLSLLWLSLPRVPPDTSADIKLTDSAASLCITYTEPNSSQVWQFASELLLVWDQDCARLQWIAHNTLDSSLSCQIPHQIKIKSILMVNLTFCHDRVWKMLLVSSPSSISLLPEPQ